MVRFVEAPQVAIPVLPAVHPVNVEVVGDDERRDLEPERPTGEQLETRETADRIEPRDDDREDQDAQDVALRDRVEREVVEEPLAEQYLAFAVGDDPFEHCKEDSTRPDG